MKVQIISLSLVVGAVLVVGCDDKKKKDAQPAEQPAAKQVETQKPVESLTQLAPVTQPVVAVDKAPVEKPPVVATTPTTAKTTVEKAPAELKEQAVGLLSDLKTAVEDRKWTDAKEIIKKLEAMKDKLSADQLVSLESLKKVVDAANLPFFR